MARSAQGELLQDVEFLSQEMDYTFKRKRGKVPQLNEEHNVHGLDLVTSLFFIFTTATAFSGMERKYGEKLWGENVYCKMWF